MATRPRELCARKHQIICSPPDIGARGERLEDALVEFSGYTRSAAEARRWSEWLLRAADYLEERNKEPTP